MYHRFTIDRDEFMGEEEEAKAVWGAGRQTLEPETAVNKLDYRRMKETKLRWGRGGGARGGLTGLLYSHAGTSSPCESEKR